MCATRPRGPRASALLNGCVDTRAAHALRRYNKADTALITGSMLREALKQPEFAKCAHRPRLCVCTCGLLCPRGASAQCVDVCVCVVGSTRGACRYLLQHPVFYELLASTDVETFEVASDAFLSFREVLTRHEGLTREFLAEQGDAFFKAFNAKLLTSSNYVTRRQSLKLLGELLLASGHVDAMMRYVGDAGHLKLIMTLLRDPSRSIQFEAFHLFKVMVANPSKTPGVVDILKGNADRLTRFLSSFQGDRDDNDPDFKQEKQTLIGMLNKL